jgi:hypothetical protein
MIIMSIIIKDENNNKIDFFIFLNLVIYNMKGWDI